MKTGEEVARCIADQNGRFTFQSDLKEFAIAAVAPKSFAYIEHVVPAKSEISIPLSSSCREVHGRLRTGGTAHTTVELSRSSRNVADRFVAPVTESGEFSACLPDGTYVARASGDMDSFDVRFEISATEDVVVVVEAYRRNELQELPSTFTLSNYDFGRFTQSFAASPRVLGMGESNHGTADYYRLRGATTLELARKGKLRFVLFEAEPVPVMRVDDYAQGTDLDLDKIVADLEQWITDTKEFRDFVTTVREYNRGKAADLRVHILGFDAQDTAGPVRLLIDGQHELGISEREAGLLARIGPKRGRGFADLASEQVDALDSLLARIAGIASGDITAPRSRAAVAARSLELQLQYVRDKGRVGLRDFAMAKLVEFSMRFMGDAQLALWAHNGHLARAPDGAIMSMGQYLAEDLKSNYAPIAFMSYGGNARAWDPGREIGVISHELGEPPAYNVESVLAHAAQDVDVLWIRFDWQPAPLLRWLQHPRYVREFGASYSPAHSEVLRQFPKAFEGLVVVRRSTPTTPSRTGERRASP